MDDMGTSIKILKEAILVGIMGTWKEAWNIAKTDELLSSDVTKDQWVRYQKKLLKTRIDADD